MRRASLFALVLGAAGAGGACDDSIDLRLIAPPGETTTTISYSCVSHVEVTTIGEDPTDTTASCLPVGDGAIRSLRDHDLAGLVTLALPRTGLRRVVVRGVRSFDDVCNSGGANTIFQGQGEYGGGWELDVALHHSLDCAAFVTTPTPVRALDLRALAGGTTAATRCAPPPDVAQYMMALNLFYPRGYGLGDDAVGIEPASGVTPMAADGTGTITGMHFRRAETPSCLAVVTVDAPEVNGIYTLTCIDPDLPTICAPAGAAEVVFYDDGLWEQAYNLTARTPGYDTDISIGVVWDPVAGTPIAGATAERRDNRSGVGLSYLSYATNGLALATGTTPASGLFAIEGDAPITVLVSAPGYASRAVVMSPSFEGNAATIIPLARR